MKVLIPSGAGFTDPGDIVSLLEARGDKVWAPSIYSPELLEYADEADVILLRGPWTASSEERLLASVLARRLESLFERIDARRKVTRGQPSVVGIGRGALVALASRVLGLCDFDALDWKAILSEAPSWVDIKPAAPFGITFPAFLNARATPNLASGKIIKDFIPWLYAKSGTEESIVGLRTGQRIFLSFVDVLAFGERTQFPDFGYRELHSLPTPDKILYPLVDGKI
ncbi:MAG: hypothetical protein JST16_06735 [Bdellovibrionales bacterium]|nr:hypothetical protein [Bdellovibrionales bacterium]